MIFGCPKEGPGCAESPSPSVLGDAQASSHAVGIRLGRRNKAGKEDAT